MADKKLYTVWEYAEYVFGCIEKSLFRLTPEQYRAKETKEWKEELNMIRKELFQERNNITDMLYRLLTIQEKTQQVEEEIMKKGGKNEQ